MIENGFIKIHRSLLDWEWHDNEYMLSVFIHCLMLANWKEKRWHGQVIPRGSFVTSYDHLAQVTGIARSTVYKCIQRLTETGEIETIRKHSYTIIKVRKYAEFQDFEEDTVNKKETQKKRSVNVEETWRKPTEESKKVRKKEELKKNTKRKQREILPDYWNPNPIREENLTPATEEEIEEVRRRLKGESKDEIDRC